MHPELHLKGVFNHTFIQEQSGAYPEGGTWVNIPPSGFLKILINHQKL